MKNISDLIKNKISHKIIFSLFIILLIFLVILTISEYNLQKKLTVVEELEQLRLVEQLIYDTQLFELETAELTLIPIASNEKVKEAFFNRDRKLLIKLLLPTWQSLKKNYRQFQFHLPPAQSFLRFHDLPKYGDDLSGFRFTVLEANKEKKVVKDLEEGRGGFGFRVVVPVFYKNKFVGTVELGKNMDEQFLYKINKRKKGFYYIYRNPHNKPIKWGKQTQLLTFTGPKDTFFVSTKIIKKVLDGNFQITKTKDDKYSILITPLLNYKGEVVGYIKCVFDRKDIIEKINNNTKILIAIQFIGLALFGTFAYLAINQLVVKRIQKIITHIKEERIKSASGKEPSGLGMEINDEISILSDELDENNKLVWQYRVTLTENFEKEKLLRKIIELIKGSFDIDEIEKQIVNNTGKLLNADMCFVFKNDSSSNKLLPVKNEYLSSSEIKSMKNANLEDGINDNYDVIRNKKEIIIPDIESYDTEQSPKMRRSIEIHKKFGVKSCYEFPIAYKEQLFGIFVVHYVKNKKNLSNEELNLIRIIVAQTGNALYQANLYENERQIAIKERILREMISEIKVSQTLNEAYNYIILKLVEIFDADRSIFCEMPTLLRENHFIQYECTKEKDLKSMKNAFIPDSFRNLFTFATDNLNPLIIEDTSKISPENQELQSYFNNYDIKSLIAIPIVRYNHDIKILGIVILISSKPKSWTKQEINLLKSITESVVTVVWDITKLVEIEELKSVFMITLAHDLQVPIIGEGKALEFLMARPDDKAIGAYKDIINVMSVNNKNLLLLLTYLLDIYKYQADKKELEFAKYNILSIIEEIVSSLGRLAEEKSIITTLEVDKEIPDIIADEKEIGKALYVILENALTYTQESGAVTIKSYVQDNELIVSISDNGPGIDENIQKKLFKRFEMAGAIERKIGSGVALYLSKLIIEAHRGRIWFKTIIGKGTTFYFSIPLG